MIDKDLLSAIEDNEEHPAIARLVEIGRQKSFITFDDILHFFPEAESDVDQLEEVFAALLSAGIPYVEESAIGGPTEEELAEEEIEEDSRRVLAIDDNYLANIDTDDTIGLYLKEVGRVPLLTAEEEVELAQWPMPLRWDRVRQLLMKPGLPGTLRGILCGRNAWKSGETRCDTSRAAPGSVLCA